MNGQPDTRPARLMHRAVISVRRIVRSNRFFQVAEMLTLAAMLVMAIGTYALIESQEKSYSLFTPPLVALLLVANLVPAFALLVLVGRRMAKRRTARSAIGSDGQMHVRLVALFSLIAAIPTLLVVIFASLLFQYGVQFWFSDSARGMLQNAGNFARGYYEQNLREVGEETLTMASDLRDYLTQSRASSPEFAEGYIYQVVTRKLNRSAIVEIGDDGIVRTAATVEPDSRPVRQILTPAIVRRLKAGEDVVVTAREKQIDAVTLLYPEQNIFLYATRDSEAPAFSQVERAQAVLKDYESFAAQSRQLQLRFNTALFVGSLLLVGTAVWIALKVADRMVQPVNELVDAARRVAAGDLAARAAGPHARDEIGTLATAFNRMTQRLEAQTTALVSANNQIESRRAFIEAILSGVTAGVVALDHDGHVRMINRSAIDILLSDDQEVGERHIADISRELAQLLDDGRGTDIVQISARGERRTLAVKIAEDASGHVITFDDITQQLADQRRAAWADVARRIAHEIKNPLTPIQLAAERLERRYAKEITSDAATFTRLTATIVRQVGDLRRIVDEFSSFARMPKPVFRSESIADIARHSLFLHEVAHPAICFEFHSDVDSLSIICDRRQMAQALTNIVKNAVEAVEARLERDRADGQEAGAGRISMSLSCDNGRLLTVALSDNGIGLPAERDRIIEPYMTTRAKGTGLGLAIVQKIVEEHGATMHFHDAPGGGTVVRITFDIEFLSRLTDDIYDHEQGALAAHGP